MVTAGVAALAIGATEILPIRVGQYTNGMLTMRQDPAAVAQAAGARDAVILVREGWGAQLIARMWALGVTRPEAERIYRSTDACALDQALAALEASGGSADELLATLAPLRADSTRLVALSMSSDTTLNAMPGTTWVPRCLRRLEEDRSGFTLWPPMLLVHDGNRWLRDLHARDSLVLTDTRPLWLLRKAPVPGSPLELEPVDVDSMHAEWQQP